MRNHEVTREQRLLDEKGNIGEPGWARRPLWAYDRADIRAPKWRIKEWDYYLVVHDGRPDGTESFAAAFTISDDGYVGLQSVSFLLLEEGKLPQGSGSADSSVKRDICRKNGKKKVLEFKDVLCFAEKVHNRY